MFFILHAYYKGLCTGWSTKEANDRFFRSTLTESHEKKVFVFQSRINKSGKKGVPNTL